MSSRLFPQGNLTLDELLRIFPSVTELGILGGVAEEIKALLKEARAGSARVKNGLTIKGFQYNSDDYWTFGSYDDDEIFVDF